MRKAFGVVALILVTVALGADGPEPARFEVTPPIRAALDAISADSMKGHLSFLASDLLEGRGTPSRGLDLAAEYIAAQFRRAGLEPAGDDGYFQTARLRLIEPDTASFRFEIGSGADAIAVGPEQVTLSLPGPLDVPRTGIVKVDIQDDKAVEALTRDDVAGKAVLLRLPEPKEAGPGPAFAARQAWRRRLEPLGPALIAFVDPKGSRGGGLMAKHLLDPDAPRGPDLSRLFASGPPILIVHDPKAAALFEALPAGITQATLSLRLGAPVDHPATAKNVVGLLRGSDPKLKDTYVLVTAHYDHLGVGTPVGGDAIYNGANDDGSGTVSVIELASALATLKPRPKRSLVFVAFFGEERGLVGSRYYASHPLFPIDQTVADLNLEQVGRTDSSEGPQISTASVTGIDYSSVGSILQAAGEKEGIRVYKHAQNNDRYFGASDNQALADLGVPAHTVCVSYVYPDYHGAGDHWDKVDFVNMAKVDRMVGLGLIMIADNPDPPRWDASNPRAKRYLKAWRDRHREAEPKPPADDPGTSSRPQG